MVNSQTEIYKELQKKTQMIALPSPLQMAIARQTRFHVQSNEWDQITTNLNILAIS